MKKLVPAVVLSCHTIGLTVIRCLGSQAVPIIAVYYRKCDMGYVSKYVKKAIYAPHPEKYPEAFINLLLDIANTMGRCVLIPADDATLSVVSKYKKVLEQKHLVACTGWEIAEKFINKKFTYQLAADSGVPTPRTVIPNSIEEVQAYGKKMEYPCLVKPCESHKYYEIFRKKMMRVGNINQMVHAYQQAKAAGLEVMLQELIPGDDASGANYNSYFWNGQPIIEFTAEKVRLTPPCFGVPRVVVSKDIPEIIELGRSILDRLGYFGYSCTEFKKDRRDGVYKLMDVNGRHNLSALLAVHCGINFPWVEYQNLVTKKLTPKYFYQTEPVCWIDICHDIFCSLKFFKTEKYSLREYIRPYLRGHAFAVWDIRDLRPFIKRLMDLGKKACLQLYNRFISLKLSKSSNHIVFF